MKVDVSFSCSWERRRDVGRKLAFSLVEEISLLIIERKQGKSREVTYLLAFSKLPIADPVLPSYCLLLHFAQKQYRRLTGLLLMWVSSERVQLFSFFSEQ